MWELFSLHITTWKEAFLPELYVLTLQLNHGKQRWLLSQMIRHQPLIGSPRCPRVWKKYFVNWPLGCPKSRYRGALLFQIKLIRTFCVLVPFFFHSGTSNILSSPLTSLKPQAVEWANEWDATWQLLSFTGNKRQVIVGCLHAKLG